MLSELAIKTSKTVKSNSPEILTALAISGVVTTSYLVGKASFKAAQELKYADPNKDLTTKERTKRVWKFYIPAGISGAVTIGCIIGASKSNARRTAAAVTAYSITEKAFSEYKEKVVEELGKGKEQKLRDQLAQESVDKTPPGSKELVIIGGGHVMCCELYTHRYFKSDMETLRKAQNDINSDILHGLYATLEEFYDLIGLPHTSVSNHMGWDDGKVMELKFSTTLTEQGEPCLAFEYSYIKPLK